MFLFSLKSKICLIAFLISVGLVIFSTVLIVDTFPNIINKELNKNVQLTKGTEQYERFLELPFPVSFKVYFFNVENPKDIAIGHKPILKEIGPYVYKQYRRKFVNFTNEKDDTISYVQQLTFEFDDQASGNLSQNDEITMLNTPLTSILQIGEIFEELLTPCLKDIFGNDELFIKVKVKDILFDGIEFCHRHFSTCEFPRTIACKTAATRKNVDKLDDGSLQFSFFNYKRKTNDGLYTIKRGIKNIQSLGQIVTLNNFTHTSFWRKDSPLEVPCDEVKGTDSTLYPPKIGKDSVLQIYSTDICRHIDIEFEREAKYQGIKGYLFSTNNSTLRTNLKNKNDDCFCSKETKGLNDEDTCFLDGVIDMQPCVGVPVILSFPHFLRADEIYSQGVEGLHPQEDKHSTFLLIEPETGTPLQGMKRIQINAVLRPVGKNKRFENLPRALLPLLWLEEGVSLTDEYVDKLDNMYFQKVKIVSIAQWSFLLASLFLSFSFGAFLVYMAYDNKKLNGVWC